MKTAFVVFDRMTTLDFIGVYDPVTRFLGAIYLAASPPGFIDDTP
jgi:hypothetical protein